MILRTFLLGGKKSTPEFSSYKIPLKIEGGMEKANDPRSAILTPLLSINF
jgi:hypothetical protein